MLFRAGDQNGDGVVDLNEFKEIVLSVDPSMKPKAVLGMYKETLRLSRGNGSKEQDADAIR